MSFTLCHQLLMRGRVLTQAIVKSSVPVAQQLSTPHTFSNAITRRVQHHLHTCIGNQNANVVYLRNLPWKITAKDISDFLGDCDIANQKEGIHLVRRKDGLLTGECYVELASPDEVEQAKLHHRKPMKNRPVQVSDADPDEFEYYMNNKIMEPKKTVLVRVRGFTGVLNKEEVIKFFWNKVAIGPYQITLTYNDQGQPTGEAFIEFASECDQQKALEKNEDETLGERYQNVVVTECSKHDKDSRTSKTGHMVFMRGLPFKATGDDVRDFLQPLEPAEVRLLLKRDHMPNGMCEVDFQSHEDAVAAMDKNNMKIGHRYIELFLRSQPVVNDEAFVND